MGMYSPVITRHDLERRHAALTDLCRYQAQQEREFEALRAQVQAFGVRYLTALDPLYKELGALETRLSRAAGQLLDSLRSRGIDPALPAAEQIRLPQLQGLSPKLLMPLRGLPPAEPLPPVPLGADIAQWAPPSLKMLYRRAAMRLHPDRARDDAERQLREQQMMAVNAAYAAGERLRLEAMLLAAGEDPVKVSGGNAQALLNWLAHCELLVQGRLRLINDYLTALQAHGMHKLWLSASQAEARGLDPINMMALRLRSQIAERRKELYISERIKPESSLARAFLHQRVERLGARAC
jgi:hypothetical protein